MSAEIDFRMKVDAPTFCALAAHARAHGSDKQDVAREILSDWARRQIHGAKMLASCLRAKGEAGAAEGIARAAQGKAGQGGDSLDWSDA